MHLTRPGIVGGSLLIGMCLAGCGGAASVPGDLASARWLILGPLPNRVAEGCPEFDQDLLAGSGGEAAAAPREGQRAAGTMWRAVRSPDGRIDLLAALGGATNAVAYAYTETRSALGGRAALKLGSDDGVKIWLNGKLVWVNHTHRALRRNEDAVAVELQKGLNRFLFKVDQAGGAWEMEARLGDIGAEEAEWAAVESPSLAIRLSTARESCIVSTSPAFAVTLPVLLTVTDSADRVVSRIETQTGVLTPLGLPRDATGAFRLRAEAAGLEPRATAAEALVLGGDRETTLREAALQARSLRPSHRLAAETLEYLAGLLEGKAHASLSGTAELTRAVATVMELRRSLAAPSWRPDTLRGLRQWAYRSQVDGSLQPFTTYLPRSYDPGRSYPLLLALHGYTGDDYAMAVTVCAGGPDDFIVAAPYGRGDLGYRSLGEQDVLDVIDHVRGYYNIDPARIYLMGISMGGLGTWRVGEHYTDLFAALAPFCGWTGTEYLGNLRNTPVLVVHGDADSSVPVGMEREAAARLRALGAPVTYDELRGVDHDAWGAWTEDEGPDRLLRYLRGKTLDPWPEELDFTVGNVAYGRHFWLRVDELDAWKRAGSLRARVAGPRSVVVTTTGVRAFALRLQHPALAREGKLTVEVNGQTIEAPAGSAEVLLEREGDVWRPAPAVSPGIARHTDGGYLDLFAGPLTIVYGTLRPERREVLKAAAESMADWAPTAQIPIGSKTGAFRVRSDTEVSGEEIRGGNLILVGDATENRLSGPALEGMPLRWADGALEAAGVQVKGAALLALHLNRQAPAYRTAVLTLPPAMSASDGVLYYAMLGARGYNVDQTATRDGLFADVVVYDNASALERGGAVWSGVWDRSWTVLRPVG